MVCDGEQRHWKGVVEDWGGGGAGFQSRGSVIRSWINSVVYCAQIRRAQCNCFVDFGNAWACL